MGLTDVCETCGLHTDDVFAGKCVCDLRDEITRLREQRDKLSVIALLFESSNRNEAMELWANVRDELAAEEGGG